MNNSAPVEKADACWHKNFARQIETRRIYSKPHARDKKSSSSRLLITKAIRVFMAVNFRIHTDNAFSIDRHHYGNASFTASFRSFASIRFPAFGIKIVFGEIAHAAQFPTVFLTAAPVSAIPSIPTSPV